MAKKHKKKPKSFFWENFNIGLDYIKKSKNFIYIITAVFALFILIGYFVPTPAIIEETILKFIEELLKKTENMSFGELIRFIFLNNLQSSFFGMIFGVFFGFFSVSPSS